MKKFFKTLYFYRTFSTLYNMQTHLELTVDDITSEYSYEDMNLDIIAKYKNETVLKLSIDADFNQAQADKFQRDVLKNSCVIQLTKGTIHYSYLESKVSFNFGDSIIAIKHEYDFILRDFLSRIFKDGHIHDEEDEDSDEELPPPIYVTDHSDRGYAQDDAGFLYCHEGDDGEAIARLVNDKIRQLSPSDVNELIIANIPYKVKTLPQIIKIFGAATGRA
jgi:hypothetical protein